MCQQRHHHQNSQVVRGGQRPRAWCPLGASASWAFQASREGEAFSVLPWDTRSPGNPPFHEGLLVSITTFRLGHLPFNHSLTPWQSWGYRRAWIKTCSLCLRHGAPRYKGGRVGVTGRAGRSLEQERNARPGLCAWGWGHWGQGAGYQDHEWPRMNRVWASLLQNGHT